jgi:hypothetical protein
MEEEESSSGIKSMPISKFLEGINPLLQVEAYVL